MITIIIFLILSELIFRLATYKPKSAWMREHDIEEYREMWGIYYPNTLGEYNLTKEEGVFRIAAVGDSFTQGGGYVDGKDLLSDSFPDYLEDMLNNNFDDRKYEVLNFGFSSTTPLEVYYITNEVVLDYKPDLVILGVTANDRWFGIYNLNPVVYCDINISSAQDMEAFQLLGNKTLRL